MDIDGVLIEDEVYQRVAVYVKQTTLGGLIKAANRDSRDLDRIVNVALEKYVEGRDI